LIEPREKERRLSLADAIMWIKKESDSREILAFVYGSDCSLMYGDLPDILALYDRADIPCN
jgi:hypothetical protein